MKRMILEWKKAIASALLALKSAGKTMLERVESAAKKGDAADGFVGNMHRLANYLEAHYAFRHNVLTDETEMAARPADGTPSAFVTVDQRALNSLSLEVQMHKVKCWDRDVQRYVLSDQAEAFHPFKAYFGTLPEWDGVDRVTALALRVSDDPLWVKGFHRWLRAATAQYMGVATMANCLIPVLVSTEQGWGKSTFCRLLLPPELRRYYTENFDMTHAKSAEMKLATLGLVNLDEFDKLTDRRLATLKNLSQVTLIEGRRTFHRYSESLYRLASFIATTNRRDLLVDKSGSRRFLCIELLHPIDTSTPIDYPQLYAQLKAEVEEGQSTWFNKQEEAELHSHNLAFYRTSVEEEVFYRCFRFARPGEEGAVVLSAADIFKEMQKANPSALRGVTAYAFSRLLPSMGKRIRHKQFNGYCVVRL